MLKIFPLPNPRLTKIHCLEWKKVAVDTDTSDTPPNEDTKTPEQVAALIQDFDAFLAQFITLVVLGKVENESAWRAVTNRMCQAVSAPPTQRVLWIDDETQVSVLQANIEQRIKDSLGDSVKFEDIRAFSSSPKIEHIIKKASALKPSEVATHKFGLITIGLAFTAAVQKSTIPNLAVTS